MRKVKNNVLNSTMELLYGREMVLKAFECGIFSRLEQSEESEQSEQ